MSRVLKNYFCLIQLAGSFKLDIGYYTIFL
jgi:hypothetical protein